MITLLIYTYNKMKHKISVNRKILELMNEVVYLGNMYRINAILIQKRILQSVTTLKVFYVKTECQHAVEPTLFAKLKCERRKIKER